MISVSGSAAYLYGHKCQKCKQKNKCKVIGHVQKVVSLMKILVASGMCFCVFPLCFGVGWMKRRAREEIPSSFLFVSQFYLSILPLATHSPISVIKRYISITYVLLYSLVFDAFEAAWQMYVRTRFKPTVFIFVMLILFYITNSYSWRSDTQNCAI